MIKIVDFSKCELSSRNLEYGGRAGEKKGIIFENAFWFLKFPKTTAGMDVENDLSYTTSPLSEYIGSHIFEILGYNVHKTILGVCLDGNKYKVVCACKDFINSKEDEILIPYTALRNDTNPVLNERDFIPTSASSISEIIHQLKYNTALSSIDNATQLFWDVLLIDLLINNNDRNEDNWGVIKNKKTGKYKMAPVYDCGNSFNSKASEKKIEGILNDFQKLQSSSLNGVTAYADDKLERISVRDILDIKNKDLSESVLRVSNNVYDKLSEIEKFINDIPESYKGIQIISKARKTYYFETFKIRYFSLLRAHAYVLSLKKKTK